MGWGEPNVMTGSSRIVIEAACVVDYRVSE